MRAVCWAQVTGLNAWASETSLCHLELICQTPRSRLQSVLISTALVQPWLSASATAMEMTRPLPCRPPLLRAYWAICLSDRWVPASVLCCVHSGDAGTATVAGTVPAAASGAATRSPLSTSPDSATRRVEAFAMMFPHSHRRGNDVIRGGADPS